MAIERVEGFTHAAVGVKQQLGVGQHAVHIHNQQADAFGAFDKRAGQVGKHGFRLPEKRGLFAGGIVAVGRLVFGFFAFGENE